MRLCKVKSQGNFLRNLNHPTKTSIEELKGDLKAINALWQQRRRFHSYEDIMEMICDLAMLLEREEFLGVSHYELAG